MRYGSFGFERHEQQLAGARAAGAAASATAWSSVSAVRTPAVAVFASKPGSHVANRIDLGMTTTQRPKEAPR